MLPCPGVAGCWQPTEALKILQGRLNCHANDNIDVGIFSDNRCKADGSIKRICPISRMPQPPPRRPKNSTLAISVDSHLADVLTWPQNHDRGSRFVGQDSVSGHLLVIYQVKHLLDLDFIRRTLTGSDHKTRKQCLEIVCGLRPPQESYS